MDWKSTRMWICVLAMVFDQWALVGRLIDAQTWLVVMVTCLAGFGIVKGIEYAKSGRAEAPAEEKG